MSSAPPAGGRSRGPRGTPAASRSSPSIRSATWRSVVEPAPNGSSRAPGAGERDGLDRQPARATRASSDGRCAASAAAATAGARAAARSDRALGGLEVQAGEALVRVVAVLGERGRQDDEVGAARRLSGSSASAAVARSRSTSSHGAQAEPRRRSRAPPMRVGLGEREAQLVADPRARHALRVARGDGRRRELGACAARARSPAARRSARSATAASGRRGSSRRAGRAAGPPRGRRARARRHAARRVERSSAIALTVTSRRSRSSSIEAGRTSGSAPGWA